MALLAKAYGGSCIIWRNSSTSIEVTHKYRKNSKEWAGTMYEASTKNNAQFIKNMVIKVLIQ